MKKRINSSRRYRCAPLLRALMYCALAGYLAPGATPVPTGPPTTRRDTVVEDLHGVKVPDPYRWLEDQSSPQTRAWIDAENRYTDSQIVSLPGRDLLRRRLESLMKVDSIGEPEERSGRYFFMKRLASEDLFVIYMRQGIGGKDEALIDPHPMSPDHTTSVTLMEVSRDGKLLAYGVRQGGQDEVAVHLFDVDGRKDLADRLPTADYYGLAIKPDRTGLYYSRRTPAGPLVFYHGMGGDSAFDIPVFGKNFGAGDILGIGLSEDGHYLLIQVFHGSAGEKTEIYYQDLTEQGPIKPVVNDLEARFIGQIGGTTLFMRTDWKAPNGRVLAVDLKDPSRDHWREVIPPGESVMESLSLAGGMLFVDYLHNVSSALEVFDPNGKHLGAVALPALGSVSGLSGHWESDEAFFGFTSFVIPSTIYRYDIAGGRRTVWAEIHVPLDADKYEVRQVWYKSKDGARVPMFVVAAKGVKRDGSNPTLMTAYGGFDVSMTPFFSAEAAAWVMNGGMFALPNLRGGGEFGEAWHKAGMLENKQRVFDDFISSAEWLIKNGYTKPSKLAITGTSNGGLLVGAALTERPDLYRAVVCRYPLLDMLRYEKFLVARFWVPEYGSAEDAGQFKYLLKYSPYENVKQGAKYPAVMFVSGDGDTRVDPLHARKMAALLQWATHSEPSSRPVLLHYDTKSGHSGGRPLGKQIDETTDELSFVFWQLGVHPN